jgi:DNA polymerase III delta prime subunit
MEDFSKIISSLEQEILATENKLDLADLTIAYGVHFFQYGSSQYMDDMFEDLDLNNHPKVFYDLGSGYGNVILYGAYHFPKATFKGIEIIDERNNVCNHFIQQLGLTNITVYSEDLNTFDFSDGDVFYLNNPLFENRYDPLVEKLRKVAEQKEIIIVAEHRCHIFDNLDWLDPYKRLDYRFDVREKICFYKSNL